MLIFRIKLFHEGKFRVSDPRWTEGVPIFIFAKTEIEVGWKLLKNTCIFSKALIDCISHVTT